MIIDTLQSLLKTDPRKERFHGDEGPKDFIFTQRVVKWISQLEPQPSEDLLIAAWGHVVRRWEIKRDQFALGTHGYHQYRYAQSKLSTDCVEKILHETHFSPERIKKIRSIMMNRETSPHAEGQVLEDALCLAFLEVKLDGYIPQWEEEAYIRILKSTLEKMSDKAKKLTATIDYSEEGKNLLKKLG